jgi:hypothetical protein
MKRDPRSQDPLRFANQVRMMMTEQERTESGCQIDDLALRVVVIEVSARAAVISYIEPHCCQQLLQMRFMAGNQPRSGGQAG